MWTWTVTGYRTGSRTERAVNIVISEVSESILQCKFFIKQPCEEPVREEIEADMGTNPESVTAVIPGFQSLFAQQSAGDKFA